MQLPSSFAIALPVSPVVSELALSVSLIPITIDATTTAEPTLLALQGSAADNARPERRPRTLHADQFRRIAQLFYLSMGETFIGREYLRTDARARYSRIVSELGQIW